MKVNKIRAMVELFLPHRHESPLKALPEKHPAKKYCFTLIGHNDKPLSTASLFELGFIGRIRNSADFVILDNIMLFKDIEIVVQIAKFYNIPRIRKYTDTKKGIEWEGNTQTIYEALLTERLFKDVE